MSDQIENDNPTNDDPKHDDAVQAPEPAPVAGEEGVETVGTATGDDIPDAVKAMPDGEAPGMTAESAQGSAEAGGSDAASMAINEPSMDIPETGVPATDAMAAHMAEFPQLGGGQVAGESRNIDLLMDVRLPVSIELGRTTLPISEILQWAQGSVVELDKLAGEPVNLMVNNKMVAMGEVVVVDEKFGLRITSLIEPAERIGPQ